MSNKYLSLAGLSMLFLFLLTALAAGGIWDTMNYQGILLDSEGARVEGLKTITFSIWDSQTSGAKYWEELHTLDINDGVVSVNLGSITPLSTLTGADQYWLQVQVTGDDPMPRIRMNAVPYAFNARYFSGYSPGNAALNIPINNGAINTSLNADKVDGFDAGNEALKVPLNNGTVNETLNADMVDGMDATDFAEDDHTHDASTIDDETGVVTDGDTGTVAIATTHTTIAQRTITAPAAGYVLVTATTEVAMFNASGDAAVTVGVTNTDGTLFEDANPTWLLPAAISADEQRNVITVHRVFSVGEGTATYYFQAFANDGNTTASAKNRYLSVVYIPSNYGTVE